MPMWLYEDNQIKYELILFKQVENKQIKRNYIFIIHHYIFFTFQHSKIYKHLLTDNTVQISLAEGLI